MFNPFKRKQKNWGVAWITPYMICNLDGATPEPIKKICKEISEKLSEYLDIMVAYDRERNSPFGFQRIQSISAEYDTFTGDINVLGAGNKAFYWSGKLENFMGAALPLTKV